MYAYVVAYGLYIKKEDSRPPFFHVPTEGDLRDGRREASGYPKDPSLPSPPPPGRCPATALLRRVAQIDGALHRTGHFQQRPATGVLRDDAQRVGAVLQRRGDDEDHLRGVVDGQLRDAGLLPVGGNEVDAHGLVRALDLDFLARDGVDGPGWVTLPSARVATSSPVAMKAAEGRSPTTLTCTWRSSTSRSSCEGCMLAQRELAAGSQAVPCTSPRQVSAALQQTHTPHARQPTHRAHTNPNPYTAGVAARPPDG